MTDRTEIALSSYWMRGQWEILGDFWRAAEECGFPNWEVSGLRCDTFHDEIHPGRFAITAFHSPAPPGRGANAAMGNGEMLKADIVLTSLDHDRRRQAVAIVRRCIEVASEYGARAVVVHLGQAGADPELVGRLQRLHLEGAIAGLQADGVRSGPRAGRLRRRAGHMLALRRSLDELIPFAAARQVRLGLENRPIGEAPSFDELEQLLSWFPDETLGYWHDTGHAQLQADLGSTPHADWLRSYGARLVGLHLHDAVGLEVHRAPGAGTVDWEGLASLVPPQIVRTIEVDGGVSQQALLDGIQHLRATHWA